MRRGLTKKQAATINMFKQHVIDAYFTFAIHECNLLHKDHWDDGGF